MIQFQVISFGSWLASKTIINFALKFIQIFFTSIEYSIGINAYRDKNSWPKVLNLPSIASNWATSAKSSPDRTTKLTGSWPFGYLLIAAGFEAAMGTCRSKHLV